MAKSLAELEKDAKNLPVKERALLAHHLIASLDKGEDVDAEEEWLIEAERRYQDYRQGLMKTKSADKVLKDAQSRLK